MKKVDAIYRLPGDVRGNRAAVETLVTTNTTILAGEVSIPDNQHIDYESIARRVIREIGYDDPELLFDSMPWGLTRAVPVTRE